MQGLGKEAWVLVATRAMDKLVENKDTKNTKRATLLARSVFEGQLARKGTKNQSRKQCIKIVL